MWSLIDLSLSSRGGVLFDFFGSVIMTTAIWFWVYEKIKKPLEDWRVATGQTVRNLSFLARIRAIARQAKPFSATAGESVPLPGRKSRSARFFLEIWLLRPLAWAADKVLTTITTSLQSVMTGNLAIVVFLVGFSMWMFGEYVSFRHATWR